MKLLLRIPFQDDCWTKWKYFQKLCHDHSNLSVVLEITSSLPPDKSFWHKESVFAAILNTEIFYYNSEDVIGFLPIQFQDLVTDFFEKSVRIVVSGKDNPVFEEFSEYSAVGSHLLKAHLDFICFLYNQVEFKKLSDQKLYEKKLIERRDILRAKGTTVMALIEEWKERNAPSILTTSSMDDTTSSSDSTRSDASVAECGDDTTSSSEDSTRSDDSAAECGDD